jgi:hypothetical protein
MFYINHVTRENATGTVKEIYDQFPEALGLPGPVLIKTIVPELAGLTAQALGFINKSNIISIPVSAAIRFILSVQIHSDYCKTFNGKILAQTGFTEEDLQELAKNTGDCPKFSPKENALIKFAVEAVRNPQAIDESRFNEVKSLGWSDEQMLVAVVNGADLVSGVTVFQAFQKK